MAHCLQACLHSARRIGGIAMLAIKAALRTRSTAALLTLLALCVVMLPRIVKSDGTPEGQLQILLAYTLGFAFSLLCLTTLWSSCALFAAEIDNARMQLSVVKPVRPVEFWLGKWLALLMLNAVALLLVYGGVYLHTTWRVHHDRWQTFECPTSRFATHPTLPTPRAEAEALFEQMRLNNELPTNLSHRAILHALEQKAPERYSEIPPGREEGWKFALEKPLQGHEQISVRIRFETEFSTRTMVKGICRLRNLETRKFVDVPLEDFTQREILFDVDCTAFGSPPGAGLRHFELAFLHTGDASRASGLMLRFRKDVVLLTPGGTFGANLLRAAIVQWSVLALLAAFGLTLSVCFSLPVAAFVGTMLLVLSLVGNSVVQVVSEEDAQKWSNRVGVFISRNVNEVTRRALQAQPLERLTHSERLDSTAILHALTWNLLITPSLFAALACFLFSRRELADID